MQHRESFAHAVCKEEVYTVNLVMYFPKNFYLIQPINKKIRILISSGVMNHIINKYIDMKYLVYANAKAMKKGPQKLTFKHLDGIFTMWIILCCFAFASFLVERIVHSIHLKMIKRVRRSIRLVWLIEIEFEGFSNQTN